MYKCIECGAEVDYEEIVESSMGCKYCTVTRSNIWIKIRPPIKKIIDAR